MWPGSELEEQKTVVSNFKNLFDRKYSQEWRVRTIIDSGLVSNCYCEELVPK